VSWSAVMVVCWSSVMVSVPVSPSKSVIEFSWACRSAASVDFPASMACLRM
jgi:hypothetical protein